MAIIAFYTRFKVCMLPIGLCNQFTYRNFNHTISVHLSSNKSISLITGDIKNAFSSSNRLAREEVIRAP